MSRHLKTVEIVSEAKGFGLKYLTVLVQFLLKHARVLEKLVIYGKAEASNQTPALLEACRLLEVTLLFLSYQRSSPKLWLCSPGDLSELSETTVSLLLLLQFMLRNFPSFKRTL